MKNSNCNENLTIMEKNSSDSVSKNSANGESPARIDVEEKKEEKPFDSSVEKIEEMEDYIPRPKNKEGESPQRGGQIADDYVSGCENDESLSIERTTINEEEMMEKEETIVGDVEDNEREKIEGPSESTTLVAKQASGESDTSGTKYAEESKIKEEISSLAFLARSYVNSDSESDDSCRAEDENSVQSRSTEIVILEEYRNKPIVQTSDEESEEDSSSEADASSSSEGESEDPEEEENDRSKKGKRRAAGQEREIKGEFDDLPPIEELKISVPEVLCDPLGEVGWMVEQMVVVKPKPGKPTLNLDTILFIERGRRVLGRIFDVFGQVSEPHYCVRFNSSEHIERSEIRVGMIVYFCPNTEYTSVVFLHDLIKMKATEDLADEEHPEFSDDEEERAYYAALKQKPKTDRNNEVPQKRQKTDGQDSKWRSKHPWSSGKKQQPKKATRAYRKPDWPENQQQSGSHQTNLWQYPANYNQWQNSNDWRSSQNSYSYNGQFNDHPRPFFRPPQTFSPVSHHPRTQNSPYHQTNPLTRHPVADFPWQEQTPSLPDFSWPLPPPPPPPPGI